MINGIIDVSQSPELVTAGLLLFLRGLQFYSCRESQATALSSVSSSGMDGPLSPRLKLLLIFHGILICCSLLVQGNSFCYSLDRSKSPLAAAIEIWASCRAFTSLLQLLYVCHFLIVGNNTTSFINLVVIHNENRLMSALGRMPYMPGID